MKPTVGGQAVIEGVMMRAGDRIATAIRKNDEIIVKRETYSPLSKRYPFLGWPFFRGVVSLFEMMYLGTKSLMYSAQESADEEGEELKGSHITLTVIVAILFSLGLFVFLPYVLTNLAGLKEGTQPVLFNLIDGIIKVIIIVGYIYAIGFMSDMRRVFEYHGAEHKAVHTFEKNKQLIPDQANHFSTVHPRCGTSFLMIVVLTGVVLFSLIPVVLQSLFPSMTSMHTLLRLGIFFLARLAMLPVIAGISYEWLKLAPAISRRSFLSILFLPGLWVQKLTTREPTPDQLEVSFEALKAVLDDTTSAS
ncbi:MAG: DUF1385 domain-containing protein [Candidatus Woesearchaeota archaeon]